MEEAVKYFQSYEGYFWQWETDTDAMVSLADRVQPAEYSM